MSYRSSKLLLGRVNFYKTLGCPHTQPHPTILRGYQRQWEDIGIFPTHPHFFVPVYVNVCDYQNSEGFQQTDSGISFIKDQMNVKTISRWPPFHTKSHLTSDSETTVYLVLLAGGQGGAADWIRSQEERLQAD